MLEVIDEQEQMVWVHDEQVVRLHLDTGEVEDDEVAVVERRIHDEHEGTVEHLSVHEVQVVQ